MGGERPGPAPRTWLGPGLPLGSVAGVPIFISPSWFLIALIITVSFAPFVRSQVTGLSRAGSYGVTFAVAVLLYGSVLAHELTHALVARSLRLNVRRIVLQLVGGVSELTDEPQTPGREYLVAMAGPLMSVLLGGIGAAVEPTLAAGTVPGVLCRMFTEGNVLVACFNLIPGLPLDGGRVLRALIWRVSANKVTATRWTAWSGRALAVVIAGYALFQTQLAGDQAEGYSFLYLLLVALFLWTAASQSLASAQLLSALPSLQVRRLARRALSVAADMPLAEAVRRARESGSGALVVVDGRGDPDGLVSENAVNAVPDDRRPWVPVSSVARHVESGLILPLELSGRALLQALQQHPASEYLVLDPTGGVYGVLASSDVYRALQMAR